MGGKRSYILKNQRIIYGHDNVSKMCFCIFLVLLVMSVIVGLTAYFVKNAQSNSEEKHDGVNYDEVGNNELLITNKVNQHPDIRNDYLSTTVDGGNVVATSNTAEFISTSVESPLSTSTMSTKDLPPRFVFVNTFGYSNTDYVEAASTNDYVRSTRDEATPLLRQSTETDFVDVSPDEDNIVFQYTTKSEIDDRSVVKRSTGNGFVSDAPLTPDENFIDSSLTTKSENFQSSLAKRSTERHFMSDAPVTPDDNFIDMWTIKEGLTDSYVTSESQSDDLTCKTDICKQSNSRMLALVNHTADPCEDFYSFACGGFDINHFKEFTVKDSVSESLSDMSSLDLTVPYNKLYRDFIISCTKYKSGRGFKEVSKFLYDFCQSHKQSLTDFIADILMLHPQKTLTRLLPLFDVIMEIGPEKTFVPTLSLPRLSSLLAENDEQDFYQRSCMQTVEFETVSKSNKSTIQQSYKECLRNQTDYFERLKDSIELFQIFEHLRPFAKKQNITQTLEFIELNIINMFGSISREELNNDKYETVAINWLTKTYPQIDWRKLFEKLFGKKAAKDITEVRLHHSEYLVKIFEFYSRHSFEEIKTSLLSMMAHDMFIDFVEPISHNDRNKYCVNLGMKLMPDVASKLYLDKFNSTEVLFAENKLKLMFQQLILTFSTSLNKNNRINAKERKDASKKVSELNLLCNPYSFFNLERNYQKLYAGVKISQDDYISNVFALKQVFRRRMYDTYGLSALSPDVIWNYLVWPISTTPFRIKETNYIVLPTSLIETLRHESQKIEEFSTIGFLIAQEISHFLYTNETSSLFVNKKVNFKGDVEIHLQDPAYSKKPNIFGIKMSEKDIQASEHSRFIDDVALRVTFDAYTQFQSSFDQLLPWTMDHDSPSNIFYILVSQSFCIAKKSSAEVAINLIRNEELPNYFRVNSMMMNSEEFLNTFECQN